MVFSTNQVRQLYVALANGQLTNAGDIKVNKTADGKQLYFTYVGALGDTMRSDLIDVDKITSITIKKASDMAKKTDETVKDIQRKADNLITDAQEKSEEIH